MFDEGSALDQRISRQYCEYHYGRYGVFATLPLLAAVLETQLYSFRDFKSAFESSGENHCRNPRLSEFIDGLTYDDKDYFDVEETRFLLKLNDWCSPISDEQLEADRRAISRELRQQKKMLKSHAKILLKAVYFWKLRFKDKCAEWRRKFGDADDAFVARRRVQNGVVGGGGPNGNTVDEGYQSGAHDSDGDYGDEYDGDFDDDDDDDDGM